MHDMTFAVFNSHINKADKRARAILAETHPALLKDLAKIKRRGGGIMAVFEAENFYNSRAALVYIGMILALVNADALPSSSTGAGNG